MVYVIKSASAPLYKSDKGSERADEALHGMAVTVEDECSSRLLVRTGYRYMGWIERLHLCPYTVDGSHYITAFAADVLETPKVQAPLLICLTLGCTVRLIEEVDGWTRIALADGREGYVRSAFLAPFSAPFQIEHTRKSVSRTAKLYLGVQYRWGGKSPYGIDCSGLCFMAYWLNGIAIYRDARIEPGFPMKEISPSCARESDLLFFPGHVGMLLDENTMIHSSESNNGVAIEAITSEWRSRITAAASLQALIS